jgi:nucleoid DNA-binding protein
MAKKKTSKKSTATATKKPPTKSEVLSAIAERTDLTKKQVNQVFEELGDLIGKNLKKSGPGAFTVPGLMKVTAVRKPAQKARKGINPFTGEETIFKAKPARTVIKIRPLKGLKDRVS